MTSFVLALVLFMTWTALSPNEILYKDTRMFFYVSGTICANLSCRLIVSQVNKDTSLDLKPGPARFSLQMSNTRCELVNFLLAPLAMAVLLCLVIPGLPATSELAILYLLAVVITVLHIHYGVCVVLEMSRHLRIDPLRIKDHGDARLISSHANDASDDSDDDETVDVNDLEVIVASSNSLAGQQAARPPVVLQV